MESTFTAFVTIKNASVARSLGGDDQGAAAQSAQGNLGHVLRRGEPSPASDSSPLPPHSPLKRERSFEQREMPSPPRFPPNHNTIENVAMGAEAVPHLIYARQLEAAAAVGEAVQPQENVEAEVAPEQPQEAKAEDGQCP